MSEPKDMLELNPKMSLEMLAGVVLHEVLPPMDRQVAHACVIASLSLQDRIDAAQRYVDQLKELKERLATKLAEPMRAWAQHVVGDRKPRQVEFPEGRVLLRKRPVRLSVSEEILNWDRVDPYLRFSFHTDGLDPEQARILLDYVKGTRMEPWLKMDTRISKTAVIDLWKRTGEIPPGCIVVGGDDSVCLALADGKRLPLIGSGFEDAEGEGE